MWQNFKKKRVFQIHSRLRKTKALIWHTSALAVCGPVVIGVGRDLVPVVVFGWEGSRPVKRKATQR